MVLLMGTGKGFFLYIVGRSSREGKTLHHVDGGISEGVRCECVVWPRCIRRSCQIKTCETVFERIWMAKNQ